MQKSACTHVGSMVELVYLMHHCFYTPTSGTCVIRVVYPDEALPSPTRPVRERVSIGVHIEKPVWKVGLRVGVFKPINQANLSVIAGV